MKRIIIDTNIYSYALRGNQSVVKILQESEVVGISSISIGELISGFKGGKREKKNREELDIFLDSPRVQLCYIDDVTADYYAEILHNLRTIGRPIPTNDIWIAACAFQHGLKLYSMDAHFHSVKGLMLLSHHSDFEN